MYITTKEHSEKVHICGCGGSCSGGDNGVEGAPKAALADITTWPHNIK